jgi:hypothetical protein
MSDRRVEQAYERELARRAKVAAMNEAKGRSLANMASKGIPMDGLDKSKAADTLSDVVDQMQQKSNLSNVVKKAEGFDPRINANVRGGKLDMIKKAMQEAGDVEHAVAPEMGMLKNNRGFAKLLPMLGMGGAALAATSMFNKANAGDIPGAALEGADLATDYIPGVSTAKMALQSDGLNEGEDQLMEQINAKQKAEAQSPNSKFSKLKAMMGR